MQPILIYSEKNSPRLAYVLKWIFTEQLQIPYRLITNEQDSGGETIVISYGSTISNALSIPSSGLLWETGTTGQNINTGTWNDIPTIFSVGDENYSLPFDIFSAIFFLLSRYEEYYTYTPDKHGRYPATESILHRDACLRRPLIDEWLYKFRQLLQARASVNISEREFSFLPTYDIDIAWSYLHKGFLRNAGGLLKDALTGNLKASTNRAKVLSGSVPDPFDSYTFISSLHKNSTVQPIFFILAALKNTPYDKNILPAHPAMQQLIKQLADYGKVGMHPSYNTDVDTPAWRAEKVMLENITAQKITCSRQHYIKMKLPDTYRFLLADGITDDYSMGYGTHLGFRAGTGRSFNWYDIERESEQPLTIHPFCFMDSTAHYEERLSTEDAFATLNEMKQKLQETGSRLTTIFHNFSLGSEMEWKGWGENYERFIQSLI